VSSEQLDSFKIDMLDQPVYGVASFCEILKRPPRTVYGWLENGHLKGVKKLGGTWVSTRRALLANIQP
jgi:hypothetical protein